MSLQEYYEAYWRQDAPSPLTDPLTPTRLGLLHRYLQHSDRDVLDVGCGPGTLVGDLRRAGRHTFGFDISERAVAIASERYPTSQFACHSVEDLPWPVEASSLDVVVAFEVIEHLLRPRALIDGARAALRTGGHLALSTPYHGLVKNLAISLLAFDKHFAPEGDHIRFFTDGYLRRLLGANGFEVERVRHFGRFLPVWAGVFIWARKR